MNFNAYLDKSKQFAAKAVEYAKENPTDVLLGVVTLLLLDIDDNLDTIEELESVQTYIDMQEYNS